MKKILWHSVAHWVPTGYGQQTGQMVFRLLQDGYDVRESCFYGLEGNMRVVDGVTCYPTDITRYGKHMLRAWARDFGDGDTDNVQIIHLGDVWPWVTSHAKTGGITADYDGLNIASWVPIDHAPAPREVLLALDRYKVRPIAMSRFGEQQLQDAGLDPLYAPHGIDTNVYKAVDEAGALKEAMGLDRDVFVVGMVANNTGQRPSRKAFPQVFQAFASFHAKHPDSFLYVHSEIIGIHEGINLNVLAQACGLPAGSYGSPPMEKYLAGTISQDAMAGVYSIMDVLANPSYGEGFGIPIVEAQACGVPVIVTDWTSMPELCGAGWKVEGDLWWDDFHSSWFMAPSVGEIIHALEAAYEARGTLKEEARSFALAYDADTVFETYWKPVLEALERPREVGPLPQLNREQRRKLVKQRKKKVAA